MRRFYGPLNRSAFRFYLERRMVAKGLDFENVTLVGVLSADISLYVDNYRAGGADIQSADAGSGAGQAGEIRRDGL